MKDIKRFKLAKSQADCIYIVSAVDPILFDDGGNIFSKILRAELKFKGWYSCVYDNVKTLFILEKQERLL